MSGYIKVFRGWRDCGVFHDERFSEREAWLWLVENAAWKDLKRKAPQGQIIEVSRGQLHTADRTLASIWQWDRKRVRRFLKRLESAQMIAPQMGPVGTTITICNYEKYQGEGASYGAKDGASLGASYGATQEEGKEEKKGNKARAVARPDGVSEQVWADFNKLRRSKRSPITDTALATIRREAERANWTLESALTECITRGWQGFKADWVGVANDQSEAAKFGDIW